MQVNRYGASCGLSCDTCDRCAERESREKPAADDRKSPKAAGDLKEAKA